MTKAWKELPDIRRDLSDWEWAVTEAILVIPPGRLITYKGLSILATGGGDASRAVGTLRRKLYRLLGHKTHVPLHRIAKQGDLTSKYDSPATRRENARRRKEEGTPQDDSAWWCPGELDEEVLEPRPGPR